MSDALPLRRRLAAPGPTPEPTVDTPVAPDAAVLARVADLLRTADATGASDGERTTPQTLT